MRFKEDWEPAKKRFEAFWNQDIIDRCCIGITALRDGMEPLPPHFKDEAYFTSADAIIGRNRKYMERTFYCAEAFPCMPLDLGASGHAGFFKGEKHSFQNTVWFFPTLENPDDLEFDENSFLFRKTLEIARAFAEDSNGDYFISMPDDTGNADALSHLLGAEELLPAMLEDPEIVQRALDKVQLAYERIMKDCHAILRDTNEGGGCVGWLNTWAPGFHAQMQCDMSVMISNEMFEEFIVPELTAQSNMLDYALYHFDGIEQIRHLDSLLSIPRLKAIQWTQVAGQPPCTEYIPELKRIQQAGKSLIIDIAPTQVQPLMEQLSSRGLYLKTRVPTEYDARELLKQVERWTHD